MIKSIYVKNFQSLHTVGLMLGKLTVVVGDTNAGKSALIRAIRAVAENKRGDSFVFTNEADCQVSIDVGQQTVTWYKPYKKSGIYYLSTSTDNANTMAIVPQEKALSVLAIKKVDLSKTICLMINFQNQLDAPFLLAESDVVKSKVLGEITNASIVLISVNQIKRWSLNNSSTYSIRAQDIANTRNALVKYQVLSSIDLNLQAVNARLAIVTGLAKILGELTLLETKVIEIVRTLTSINNIVSKARNFEMQIPSLYFGQARMQVDAQRLQFFYECRDQLDQELVAARLINKKIGIIKEGIPDVTRVEQLMSQMTVLAGYDQAARSNKRTMALFEDESERVEKSLELADEDLVKIRQELKICPLCESPML